MQRVSPSLEEVRPQEFARASGILYSHGDFELGGDRREVSPKIHNLTPVSAAQPFSTLSHFTHT